MKIASGSPKWICCQLGAREHYAIPRALRQHEVLDQLVTDAWVPPLSFLANISGHRFATANPSFGGSGVRDRFHRELGDARVTAFNSSLILFEALAKARRLSGWPLIIARNRWFQRKVVGYLARNAEKLKAENLIVFAYSYAARDIFRFAKQRGWKTVLGQIDPGPVEEEIVQGEHEGHPEFAADWKPAPPEYWQNWREECDLADHIMANSEWSRAALVQGGVSGEKLSVIPLAYEMPEVPPSPGFGAAGSGPATAGKLQSEVRRERQYPDRFDEQRPLRVLFLGQINLRKGIARLLEAAKSLRNEPVEFWMVGPMQCQPPDHLRNLPNVCWLGRAARAEAHRYYREADVFLLPTLSDGYALTQLEARAHGLPVIASRCCGEVVKHGMNGLLLDEPAADAIVEALRFCLEDPGQLAVFSAASRVEDRFSIDTLGQNLLALGLAQQCPPMSAIGMEPLTSND